VGSRNRWTSQHQRPRERGRHSHRLGHHLYGERNGDQGADPNKLEAITDDLSATTLPATESFFTLQAAGYGEVLRGVSLTPGTGVKAH
jgi:hypothetical protein